MLHKCEILEFKWRPLNVLGLLYVLFMSCFRYKKIPKMDIHKRENLDIAFRFLTTVEKVPLVNIGEALTLHVLHSSSLPIYKDL